MLRVKNGGTLALKYKLEILTKGTASGDAAVNLADVINGYVKLSDEAITEAPTADLTGYRLAGTLAQLMADPDGAAYGTLSAGKAAYAGIVLKMQEDADNDYQGASVGATFDLVLSAAQQPEETDGFDNPNYDAEADIPSIWNGGQLDEDGDIPADPDYDFDYDADAGVLYIHSANDLVQFAANVNAGSKEYAGKTVAITTDIDLAGVPWRFIDTYKNGTDTDENTGSLKDTVIDGQNHTIYTMQVEGEGNQQAGYGKGFIGSLGRDDDITIKNLTFSSPVINAQHASYNVSGNFVGVVVGSAFADVTLENVNVIGGDVYGFGKVGALIGGTNAAGISITIDNCTVRDTRLTGTTNVGGLAGMIFNTCPVKIVNTSMPDVTFTMSATATYVDEVTVGENREPDKEQPYKPGTVLKGNWWKYAYTPEDYYYGGHANLFVLYDGTYSSENRVECYLSEPANGRLANNEICIDSFEQLP